MPLSSREIKEILAILGESGWDEAQVTIGDVTLAVSKAGAGVEVTPTAAPPDQPIAVEQGDGASRAATAQPPGAVAAGEPPSGHVVTSPSVGIFWRSPEPGAEPFVEVGHEVQEGQTLCIVEVMKLMQYVIADVAGVITTIHTENAQQVEFGTPLFSISTASA